MTDLKQSMQSKIYEVRGQKVMLSHDLAELYSVETKRLNEQVKRNTDRFPRDFMFQLTTEEFQKIARSQNATFKKDHHIKYCPYAFTEHGVAMLSGVLNSKMAIQVNVQIIREFIELRRVITTNTDYELLKSTMQQVNSRMDTIEANHLVDNTILSSEMSRLKRSVKDEKESTTKIAQQHNFF